MEEETRTIGEAALDAVIEQASGPAPEDRLHHGDHAHVDRRRDRLLASLTLMAGVGLLLGLPFALKLGAEFFLPLVAAIVVAIAFVPLLEWLERSGVPSRLAALICMLLFIAVANVALAAIIVPATAWFQTLPERIPQIQANLAPLIDFYSNLQKFVDDTVRMLASGPVMHAQAEATQAPTSLMAYISSAPSAALQLLFILLVIYFFLSGWTQLRRRTITSRGSFDGALATARVIQNVVDATSAYIGTITLINVSLGLAVALGVWLLGMPSPLMWGGIVALLNYIPYLGPILAATLIALGGLMTFNDIWWALAPAAMQVLFHVVEANIITPTILGRRLTINPLLIMISLAFWGWVWGTPGALLAVPLLIIIQTIASAAGKPDIAGFLFEEGTLTTARYAEDDLDYD
ncbi:MAG: AI-2E family transporter [Sphingomonas sanxanigenens]|uniref:AI-2E family transporter n=1 Tax=Sphingomonas sanxanigenens TaxID=397260 RepID=A0A2W5C3A4_9SPHN|nr:MAG: AI-2E family transporter [Sphingomonas sanxanigenens]